jgi:hypothetical protein
LRPSFRGDAKASNPQSRDSGFALRAPRNDSEVYITTGLGSRSPSFGLDQHDQARKFAFQVSNSLDASAFSRREFAPELLHASPSELKEGAGNAG